MAFIFLIELHFHGSFLAITVPIILSLPTSDQFQPTIAQTEGHK